MPISTADIAAAFERAADLLELRDANPLRVRAYRNAARLIGELKLDLAAEIAAGRTLPTLPGIGDKLRELATTGRLDMLERLHHEVPSGIDALLRML